MQSGQQIMAWHFGVIHQGYNMYQFDLTDDVTYKASISKFNAPCRITVSAIFKKKPGHLWVCWSSDLTKFERKGGLMWGLGDGSHNPEKDDGGDCPSVCPMNHKIDDLELDRRYKLTFTINKTSAEYSVDGKLITKISYARDFVSPQAHIGFIMTGRSDQHKFIEFVRV